MREALDRRGKDTDLQWIATTLAALPAVAGVGAIVLTGGGFGTEDVAIVGVTAATAPIWDRLMKVVGEDVSKRVMDEWLRQRGTLVATAALDACAPPRDRTLAGGFLVGCASCYGLVADDPVSVDWIFNAGIVASAWAGCSVWVARRRTRCEPGDLGAAAGCLAWGFRQGWKCGEGAGACPGLFGPVSADAPATAVVFGALGRDYERLQGVAFAG